MWERLRIFNVSLVLEYCIVQIKVKSIDESHELKILPELSSMTALAAAGTHSTLVFFLLN